MITSAVHNKVSSIVVHTFTSVDVDDPDLYAAVSLSKWQDSELGQWVMEHAVETPWWEYTPDLRSLDLGYYLTYRICAKLTKADQVFYRLKFE